MWDRLPHTSTTTRTKRSVKGEDHATGSGRLGCRSPSHTSSHLAARLKRLVRKKKTTLNTVPDFRWRDLTCDPSSFPGVCAGSFQGIVLQHLRSVGLGSCACYTRAGQLAATKEGSICVLMLSRRPPETSLFNSPSTLGFDLGYLLKDLLGTVFKDAG